MTPAEVIREGRNQLFERGWYQGALNAPNGSVCALGALAVASDMCNLDQWLDAENYVHKALPAPAKFVSVWNDAPERTFDEVVDLFDRAEKLAEADEAAS